MTTGGHQLQLSKQHVHLGREHYLISGESLEYEKQDDMANKNVVRH